MNEDDMSRQIAELERRLDGDELSGDEMPIDTDELIHQQEHEGAPPAMPLESLEDFEKAIGGEDVPHPRMIPPSPGTRGSSGA